MPGAMRKPRQPRGVAGGKRNQPDKVQRQQAARSADKRVNLALVSVQEHQSALEARIAETEAAIREVEQQMSAPGFYEDRAGAQPVIDRHQALMWQVGDLMHQWETLQAEPAD